MHKSSGRWRLGLGLALTTAILWGFLPIGLVLLLDYMDAYTIVWYRFLFAALTLLVVPTLYSLFEDLAERRKRTMEFFSVFITACNS